MFTAKPNPFLSMSPEVFFFPILFPSPLLFFFFSFFFSFFLRGQVLDPE